MDLHIINGTVITAEGRVEADVAVNGGKIAAVVAREDGSAASFSPLYGNACCLTAPKMTQQNRLPACDEVVDASGLLVLPGAIDAHTHFELPFGGSVSSDDFYTGTRAAACGGVTTVIDFVMPAQGECLSEAYAKRRALADPKVCIDYGLHMALTDAGERTLADMEDMVNAGVSGFKVFMTYAFRVTDDQFARVLSRGRELGALIMVHAEAHDELEALKAQFVAQGKTDPWHHYLSRPESVETAGVERAIELAVGGLYIVHLGCAGGVEAVRRAQREGHGIIAETCPQYLRFTSDVFKRPDGHNFVCSPPMKGQASKDALWEGIADGTVSVVATDHCPFTLAEKAQGKDDFTKIPNGVMGTEILYPYMLSCANEGLLSYELAVELCCSNPAKIFGYASSKGSIAPGLDADIVLYDPRKDVVISRENMHSAVDYTIWEGTRLKGYPVATYARGKLVCRDGEFVGERGSGLYIPRPLW